MRSPRPWPDSRRITFADKSAAVTALVELKHPNGRAVLAALLDSKLYLRNADNKVFITDGGETELALTDPLTLTAAGKGKPDDYSRITTNNSLRKALRSAVAAFALSDPDADVRLAAVRDMLRSIDDENVALLRAGLEKEADDDVRQAMREGIALADLDSTEAETRLAALGVLEKSLSPDVFNRLTTMITAGDGGAYPSLTSEFARRPGKSSHPSSRPVSCTRPSRRCSSVSAWAACWCSPPSASRSRLVSWA